MLQLRLALNAYRLTILIAAAAAVVACSVQTRQIVPTPDVIKQIGLPVYPNARPVTAHATNQSSGLGLSNSIAIDFTTKDDISRVQAWYAAHVPSYARKMTIPLGVTTTIAYQWYEKDNQKQVLFERIKDTTLIQLQSIKLALPGAHPSATPRNG